MQMKRAVLFDFDLTLADSTMGVVECVNYALAKIGFPLAEREAIEATIGLTLPATLAQLTRTTDAVLATNFASHFVQRADLRMVDLTSLFPDVPRVIQELRKAEIKTGIVSTKYRHRIHAILTRERLNSAFDVIVGGEDVLRHKPDPEGIRHALTRMGISARNAVYVGDHPVDAMAASAAAMSSVITLTGRAVRRDFDRWPEITFIKSLRDLVPLLIAN